MRYTKKDLILVDLKGPSLSHKSDRFDPLLAPPIYTIETIFFPMRNHHKCLS